MRAYVAITPQEVQSFLSAGHFKAIEALMVDQTDFENLGSDSDTQEELEFESSWQAAMQSRAVQVSPNALGMVLAVDLAPEQMGAIEGNHVGLLSELSWSQVQSLLLAESEERELSWFAAQEISTYLPQWLA
jgi:hypothetical protein